jgi:uncharacterized spore protein YtfJ
MQENLKERLEDFQDLLFLKRLVEQNIEEESTLIMPIRFSVQNCVTGKPIPEQEIKV